MSAMDLAEKLFAAAMRNKWRAIRALPLDHVMILLEGTEPDLHAEFMAAPPEDRQEAVFLVTEAEVASFSLRAQMAGISRRPIWPMRDSL